MVLGVVLAFTLVGFIIQNRRVTDLEIRLLRLTRGADDGNLQDVLESHLEAVARVVDDVDALAARSAALEARSMRALQRIGFVRFNPFEDTGGNQSFVLALLDGHEDGVLLSSLHTRAATRIYAKTVSGGTSDGALSDEESQALELARSGSGGRTIDGRLDVRVATAPSSTSAPTVAPGPALRPAALDASVGSSAAASAPPVPASPLGPSAAAKAGTTSPR